MAMILCSRHARLCLVLLGSLAALVGCTSTPAQDLTSQRSLPPGLVFKGAWFEITYPADFTPVPSLHGSTAEGYDSATFISPDETVSFYVYAPQWGGEPTDITLDPLRESVVSEKMETQDGLEVRWLTICAKDGGYCRAYQDTMAYQGSVRTTVGITYRNEEARRQYLPEYLKFRQSLQQFAD
jgi:hypothetical protein